MTLSGYTYQIGDLFTKLQTFINETTATNLLSIPLFEDVLKNKSIDDAMKAGFGWKNIGTRKQLQMNTLKFTKNG